MLESLLKGSEPLFIASGKQYSIVAFPDDKTGTGRLNATESDVTTIAQRQNKALPMRFYYAWYSGSL